MRNMTPEERMKLLAVQKIITQRTVETFQNPGFAELKERFGAQHTADTRNRLDRDNQLLSVSFIIGTCLLLL